MRENLRMEHGGLIGALAHCADRLDADPTDIDARLTRAELYLDIDELEAAEAELDAALAHRPDEPRLLCLKGSIALERDALSAAIALLDRAIARDERYAA